jgi:hypothetical protein
MRAPNVRPQLVRSAVPTPDDSEGYEPDPALLAFLLEQLSDEDGGEFERVELRQSTVQGDRPVGRWRLEPGGVDVHSLASRIYTSALRDARAFRGSTVYAACLFTDRDKGGSYSASQAFRVHGGAAAEPLAGAISESEPATESGLTAQLMRHNEACLRLLIGMSSERAQENRRALETRDMRTAYLEKNVDQMQQAREQLLDHSAARQLEHVRLTHAEDRKNLLANRLAALLPVVGNRLLGKVIDPRRDDAKPPGFLGKEILQSFLSSIDGDQMQRIFESGLLRPEQLGTLIELNSIIGDDYEAEQKREAEASKAASSPAAPSSEAAAAAAEARTPMREPEDGVVEESLDDAKEDEATP